MADRMGNVTVRFRATSTTDDSVWDRLIELARRVGRDSLGVRHDSDTIPDETPILDAQMDPDAWENERG